MRQVYTIETVIEDVGWLRPHEEQAVKHALGVGTSVYLDPISKQLHASWNLEADVMDEAIDAARAMHHGAKEATGIYVPRTSLFIVREIGPH